MSGQKYASQAVEDLQESTGLADNFDATITEVKFTAEAPSEKYTAEGSPLFSLWSFKLDDGQVITQSYSLGASAGANFTIGDDGYGLVPNTDDSTLRKDSKHGTLLASLQTEGLPKAILQAGDFSKLITLRGHFKRVADKARNFTSERAGAAKKFPPTTLVCTRIIALPGVGAATTSTKAVAAVAATSDIDARAGQYLVDAVVAKDGKLQKGQILVMVSTAAKKAGDADYVAVAKRASDEAFLNTVSDIGLSYDGKAKPQVVTLAA